MKYQLKPFLHNENGDKCGFLGDIFLVMERIVECKEHIKLRADNSSEQAQVYTVDIYSMKSAEWVMCVHEKLKLQESACYCSCNEESFKHRAKDNG